MLKHLSIFFLLAIAACGAPENNDASVDDAVQEPAVEQGTADENGVFFLNLNDLDTVTSPFVVEMGVRGMQVEPKGKIREGFGHHHLLIDQAFVEEGVFMPATDTLIHYGGGETVDTVSLESGKHYLTLQFGDGMHNSYGFDWSRSITVYVR